jgi:6-pyruvoyltetrahydropterin/6-carboxytetrahydropterin synthase
MPAKTKPSKPVARPSRPEAARVLDGIVYVTRQVHFNAAHQLANPAFDRRWNEKTYGPCTNPHWHGHNYVLEATVSGSADKDTGYVIDLAELKRILHTAVVEPCDHRNLNQDVDFLRGIIPSTENLVIAFWNRIEPHLRSGRLHSVRLYETPRNFVEYFGP